jgi:hypothetical protein
MKYQWTTTPVDGEIAAAIRRDNRKYRRDKGRGGHRFRYVDLRFMWIAGTSHVILTHYADRCWQYWWRHPSEGWMLQSWHDSLSEAKDQAESLSFVGSTNGHTNNGDNGSRRKPGVYVTGVWKDEPYRDHLPPLTIRCSTTFTQGIYVSILKDLGCSVTKEIVS